MAPAIQTLILLTLTAILQAEELLLKQKCEQHEETKRREENKEESFGAQAGQSCLL
jgi:hypothetical protein